MKVKEGYILKNVADSNVIVPINGGRFESIMTLSESGAYIFGLLKDGASKEDIVMALCSEYDVDGAIAKSDVDDFLDALDKAGLLCND